MSIDIFIPNNFESEKKWIISTIFNYFWKIQPRMIFGDYENYEVVINGKKLILKDSFFSSIENNWLDKRTLPKTPLKEFSIQSVQWHFSYFFEFIPIIYGEDKFINLKNNIYIGVDILGSAFFMLSRYEEFMDAKKDEHSRFSSKSSVLNGSNVISRPIINEYLELLWGAIESIDNDASRNDREFKKYISCDLDFVLNPISCSFMKSLRRAVYEIVRQNNYKSVINIINNYINIKTNNIEDDLYYKNIFWIMDENEKVNNKVAFYFIPISSNKCFDPEIDITHKIVQSVLKKISLRGHEVGIHPAYNSYDDELFFNKSVEQFKLIINKNNINQDSLGGRQHFLRVSFPKTFHFWEKNNLMYDSSLIFPDKIGFRCGICYSYPMFDVVNKSALNLVQRPLLIMDGIIFSKDKMNYDYSDSSLEKLIEIKKLCKFFRGDFTLLWHNSYFNSLEDKLFYKSLIE